MSAGLMFPKGSPVQALIVGGRGAIGGAVAAHLEKVAVDHNFKLTSVITSRDQNFVDSVNQGSSGSHQSAYVLNPSCEKSFAAFTSELKGLDFKPNLIFNACGMLHDHKNDIRPEVSFRKITEEAMRENFSANLLSNALSLRFLLGELAEPKAQAGVYATLSAKVGSISENHLGGWYSYRACKSAVNQLVHSAAIEARRTHKGWRLLALHPGTVQSPLSQPFMGGESKQKKLLRTMEDYEALQAAAEPGVSPYVYWTPELCAERLLHVMFNAQMEDSGKLLDYAGRVIPP